ncbi:hypothetical protein GGF37_007146 [Kickxella alabastrina]|nr:hypothetical protein GGF37_007146 [Kickxella alabastrina]
MPNIKTTTPAAQTTNFPPTPAVVDRTYLTADERRELNHAEYVRKSLHYKNYQRRCHAEVETEAKQTQKAVAAETTSAAMETDQPKDNMHNDDLIDQFDKWKLCTLFVPCTTANSMEVQLLHDDAMMPCKAYPDDTRFDVYCITKFVLEPKAQHLVPLGIAAKVPIGTYLHIAPHSSLAAKGVTVLRGIVDGGYHCDTRNCSLSLVID